MVRFHSRVFPVALVASLLLSACGGGSSGDGSMPTDTDGNAENPLISPDGEVLRNDVRDTDQLYAYRPDGAYASVLKECALIDSADDACTLSTLPFIKQATPDFTRSDIVDRLLVTHPWMGQRFEALIAAAPDSMIQLFGSITAISIGSTVRPSNYWTGTGAIQLDPENLWLTIAEKANVSIEEDYRSGFGADLQYWAFGTLRDGDQAAIKFFNLTDTRERTLDDIKYPMYRLLFHELAHAVDYMPEASIPSLDASLTPNSAIYRNRQFALSPQLVADLPLYSQTLYELGQVSFRGETATDFQKSITPADAGNEMAGDGAMRYYGYSTDREDFATLFALTMMKFSFGLDYHIGYVQKPVDENNYSCSELTVGWGMRNRLADALVNPRAKRVFEQIYGTSTEFDAFFANGVGQTNAMTPGVDWCTNRDGGVVQADAAWKARTRDASLTDAERRAQFEQLEAERLNYTH